jgi:hypothetical protein
MHNPGAPHLIYQLIKRQAMWKVALGFSVLCAAAALVRVPGIAFLPASMAILFLMAPSAVRRCALFEAGLPIRGRDIFFARLLGNLAALWSLLLPAFASVAVSRSGTKSASLLFIFEVGTILTLAIVAIQSAEVDQFEAPTWWQAVVVVLAGVALVAALAAFFDLGPHIAAYFPAGYVAWASVLGAGALLVKTWTSVPEALQREPFEAEASFTRSQRRTWLPPFAWSPILRMTRGLVFFFLVFCAMTTLTGGADPWLAVPLLAWFCNMMPSTLRRESWVFALPISRQKIFLYLCSPAFLGIVAGACASRPRSVTATFFECAITAIVFLTGFIAMRGMADRPLFPWRFRLTLRT